MSRRRARRTDTSHARGGPQLFDLQAGYFTRPGDDFAALLPLSADLVNRLNAWNESWEASAPYEAHAVWTEADDWLAEGAELARLVQLEAEQAGMNIQVTYRHDRSRNPRRGPLSDRKHES